MPTTGARVAKVSRANLAAGGSLGPTGMLPSADRRGGWRAQWSTHLPGTSYGDTTSIHLSSPICPPTRKAMTPKEVQELLGAMGGAGGNHVPSSERLAATSLHRPLHALHPRLQKPLWLEWESRLCCSGEGRLWIPRLACLISPSSSHSIRYWPKAPAPVQCEALGATSPISAARRKPSARNLGAGTPEPITLQPLATDHGHCPAHLHVPMAQVGSLVCKNENIF